MGAVDADRRGTLNLKRLTDDIRFSINGTHQKTRSELLKLGSYLRDFSHRQRSELLKFFKMSLRHCPKSFIPL